MTAKFETRAIHAGQKPDRGAGATIVPVYQTSTFTQQAIGEHLGYEYSRCSNPTRTALEECLASLENARFGVAYASGMAAIAGVMQLVNAGDHVVVADDLYGGTYRQFTKILPRYGVTFSFVDATNLDTVAKAIRPETKMLWIESPTNPMLRLVDIAGCAKIAKQAKIPLVVDNTFATPYLQNPLELGATIIVHSTTKYIGGHSDVIGGAVIVNDEETYRTLRATQNATGAVPGPWDAWLTLRGVKTLAVRMKQHQENAFAIAKFLREQPQIAKVHYPGFPDHPGYEIAIRQMRGFGGMVTIELKGGESAARELCKHTEVFSLAESLGGIESLIGYPWLMSHGGFPAEEKFRKGIGRNIVRLSIGIEHIDDLCNDLAQALAKLPKLPK